MGYLVGGIFLDERFRSCYFSVGGIRPGFGGLALWANCLPTTGEAEIVLILLKIGCVEM